MNALVFDPLDTPCYEPCSSAPCLPHPPQQRRVLFPKRSIDCDEEKHSTRINKRPRTGLPMMPVTIDTSENIPDDLPPKIQLSRRSTKTDIPWQASETRRTRWANEEIPQIPDLLLDDVSEALRQLTLKRDGSSAFSVFSGRRSLIRSDSKTYLSKAA
jgi:hypothetical protein